MRNLFCLIIICFWGSHILISQHAQLFQSNSARQQGSSHSIKSDLLGASFSQEERVTRRNQPVKSLAPVPIDIIDLTGKWYNAKNDCVVALQWDGKKWVATIDGVTRNENLRQGEVIAEFYPIDKAEIFGRLKVMKKGYRFKWEEVKYKVNFTQLKGKHSWEFYSK